MPSSPPATSPPLSVSAWLRYGLIRHELGAVPPGASVLEVGSGQGAMAVWLASRYAYVGLEPDAASAAVARSRLAQLPDATLLQGGLEVVDAARSFDAVCAFEVLEHIEDDRSALEGWRDRVRPGGLVVLSVPAFQQRFGPMDGFVGHHRRYEPAQLRALMEEVGLTDVSVRLYGFPLGNLMERIRNGLAARRTPPGSPAEGSQLSGRLYQPPGWSGTALRLLTAPFRALQHPFARRGLGCGLVASGRRPA